MQTWKMLLVSLAVLGIAAGAREVAAQNYPSRPIKMIVPFPAGGPTDAIGRVVAAGMQASLGRPVVIENVPGAAGSLGTGQVARATADGYTLGLGNSVTHVANGAIYPLDYDILADFAPVALLTNSPAIIVAKKAMQANDLRELIGWLKSNPDKALVGTAGPGSASHELGLMFEKETGTHLQFIPYRGLGPAIQDLMAGQVDIVMSLPSNALPQIEAGTIKAYAVTSNRRLVGAPGIPTVDEAGMPGFYYLNWHALFAPKGTPNDIVAKLNAVAVAVLADPATRQRLIDLGQEIFPADEQTPAALAAFQKADIAKRWPIIKAAGIKAD